MRNKKRYRSDIEIRLSERDQNLISIRYSEGFGFEKFSTLKATKFQTIFDTETTMNSTGIVKLEGPAASPEIDLL